MRIVEKEPNNLDDALNMASRLEASDIMGFAGQEGKNNKSRFTHAAAGGKESTGSKGAKILEVIVKQSADLKVLMSSYRRDIDRQQQEITMLRRSHQRSYSENSNLSPDSHPAGVAWPGGAVLSWSPLRISANPRRWAVGPSRREEDTESVEDLDPVILAETVEKGATGPANAESPRNT